MKLIFDEEDTNIPLEIQKRWEVEDFNVVEWSKSIPITSHLSPNSSITVKEVNTDGHLSLPKSFGVSAPAFRHGFLLTS